MQSNFLPYCKLPLEDILDDIPTNIGVARIFDWGGAQTTNHMQ